MPEILRFRNFKICIYPKDHEPPHVHVLGPGCEAKFRISDFECLSNNGFKPQAIPKIQAFLKEFKTDLTEAWDEYQK